MGSDIVRPVIGAHWHFGVLGPLVVERDGQPVDVPGGRARALLALLLAADGPLSRDRLIDELWGECPPPSAVSMLHIYLSKLRGPLGELLEHGPAGYALARDGVELDVRRFDALIEAARQARPDLARAGAALSAALGLFRGDPLCDVEGEGSVAEWRRTLEEARWEATLARFDVELEAGEGGALLSDLERHARQHPLDERLGGQLMLALYRAGRQTEALETYRRIRVQLRDELGLEPGRPLHALHQQILEHAPSLDGQRAADIALPSERAVAAVLMLPALPSATVGREDTLEDVVALLGRQDVRIVTLTGPGGVGKTRLALLTAHAAAGTFADGASWIELAGVAHAEEVPSTILRSLGVTPTGGETGEQALCRALAASQQLLVLDNFEHVIDSAPLLAALHRHCPQLTVLVTSREPLDLSAEHCYAVAPLELPDRDRILTVEDMERTPSTAMFLAAARRRDHHFALAPADVSALARICTRLEGLPLALELAAARTTVIDVGQLAADLETQLDRLGTGPRDAPARQRTLEATIEWGFALLDPHLQAVFTRFAVFAGGATPDAVCAVTGARDDALEALVAKSMLTRRVLAGGDPRLGMLDTLRHYALRRLVDDPGEAELRRRHLEYYLALAERAVARLETPDESQALVVLDHEIENLHAAREWALAHAPDLCLRLTGQLGAYWGVRRHPAALTWCEEALHAAGVAAPVRDRALTEQRRAKQLELANRLEEAVAAAQVALELYRQVDDHAGMATALRSMASNTGLIASLAQARGYAEDAVRHARASGNAGVLARALGELAEYAEGDERGPLVEQAAAAFTRTGDTSALIDLYMNCAYVALIEGRAEEANQLLIRAGEVPDFGDRTWGLRVFLSNLGLARLFTGEFQAAREAFAGAVAATHSATDFGESLAGLAAVAAVDGDHEVAARLRGAARTAGYPPSEYDRPIDERLTHDYLTPAREHLGPAWDRGEAIGATWTPEEATAYALAWARADAAADPTVAVDPSPVSARAGGAARR